MTDLDFDRAIYSLLSDIGDAATSPKEFVTLRHTAEQPGHGDRPLTYLIAACFVVVVGAVAGLVISRLRTDDVSSVVDGGSTYIVRDGGQWLDLPAASEGMNLVPGTPEARTICVAAGSDGQSCDAVSGFMEVAYSTGDDATIEIRTSFTGMSLEDYVDTLKDSGSQPLTQTSVTVRNTRGLLLRAGVLVLVWQERPGVIAQIRLVDDPRQMDLVDLAESLVLRPPVFAED